MSEMKDKFEVWVLPAWASNTIMETLSMDAESSMIDPELRKRNQKADIECVLVDCPKGNRGRTTSRLHQKESLERFS